MENKTWINYIYFLVYASDKYVYAYGDSVIGTYSYPFSLYIFNASSLKLIKVYILDGWNRYYGFRDDGLKTDVLYWVESIILYKFYFDGAAYGLKEYVLNSGYDGSSSTKLMMKQVLVYSNINTIIIIRRTLNIEIT